MVLVEIARPPDDAGGVFCKMHDVLAGAASDFDDVTGFAGEEFLQHRPDRLMVAVERRRIEPAVGFDRPAVLAQFHHIFRHVILALNSPQYISFSTSSRRSARGSATR